MTHPAPIFIRPTQVPAAYGISRATLYRWAEKGLLFIFVRIFHIAGLYRTINLRER